MKTLSIDPSALAVEDALTTAQQRKREDKLQTIVEDARRVLQREGYGGFTLRKVASEANVPLGTLQHYFSTRELLLRTVILQTIKEYNDNYERIAQSAAPAEQRLLAIIDLGLQEIQDQDARIFFIEIAAVASHHSFAAQALAQSHKAYLGTLSRLIGEINPKLNARECDLRALLIAAQIEGIMVFFQGGVAEAMPDAESLRRAVRVVASSLSNAE